MSDLTVEIDQDLEQLVTLGQLDFQTAILVQNSRDIRVLREEVTDLKNLRTGVIAVTARGPRES